MNVPIITGPRLRALIESGEPLRLVHAGDPAAFRRAHIPGSMGFAEPEHALTVLRRHDRVVVYGADAGCRASPVLVARLVAHGVRATRWYAGGLADWIAAGGPLEGTRRSW